MKPNAIFKMFFSFLFLCFVACKPPIDPTPPSTIDGKWIGSNIEFTVTGNGSGISSFELGPIPTSIPGGSGTDITSFQANTSIVDSSFSCSIGGIEIIGKFDSLTKASGTYKYNQNIPNVGTANGSGNWDAIPATSDVTIPSDPSISINNGAASTDSLSVKLKLSAIDDLVVNAYCAKESSETPSENDAGWKKVMAARNYVDNVDFTLSGGLGTKTVYVWFRDRAGNISAPTQDSIEYIPVFPGEWKGSRIQFTVSSDGSKITFFTLGPITIYTLGGSGVTINSFSTNTPIENLSFSYSDGETEIAGAAVRVRR